MKLGLVGATGVVGRTLLEVLADHSVTLDEIRLMASERSVGMQLTTPLGRQAVQLITPESCKDLDVIIFSAGSAVAKQWAPVALEAGCRVIDMSSAFRYDDNVALVIPEINPTAINDAQIIANPNCTTAIAVMAVYPIYQAFGLKRMIISTYQSASGAGQIGLDDLLDSTVADLADLAYETVAFPHNLAFNVIPCIDALQDNGYTKEEMKVAWETQKIFGAADMQIACTAVRVPVKRVHAESICLETTQSVSVEAVRSVLRKAPGVKLCDDTERQVYPMPSTATGCYDVEVGRVRRSLVFGDHGIELFVAGDQLLRGAALNAVKILQLLFPASS